MITDLKKKTDKRIVHKKCLHAKVIRSSYWDKKKAQYVNTYHCARCLHILTEEEVTFFRPSTDRPVAKYQCGKVM